VRFQLKQYASEAVAFDTASGDTHYLAPLALALYQICRDCPGLSRDDTRQLLAQRHAGVPGGPPPDAQIEETLDGLRRIGLIRLE
jgi:PqqD family protein of HPr-rel-A system